MGKILWEKWAGMLICIAFVVIAVLLGFRYLFPVLLPFLFAWMLSLAVRPLAGRISSATGIPRKLCAVILLLLLLGALLAVIYLTVGRVVSEIEELVGMLLERVDERGEGDFFSIVSEKLSFFKHFSEYREQINQMLSAFFSNLMATLTSRLPNLVGGLLSTLPDLFFVILVTVVAGFYFCTSDSDILQSLCDHLPLHVQKKLPLWKGRIKRYSWRFLRAYLLLLALTFALLLAGFLILRQRYAFLLALVIALVDLLPVLGVGTVLLPWALIVLWNRQYFLGIGLLILYAVVLTVRQIMEPKLLGKSFGLHPLLALLSTFAGWYLFGLWGMLLSPIAAVLVKTLFEAGRNKS